MLKPTLLCLLLPAVCCAQAWVPQTSGSTASLRGISAVTERVAWASGAKGTVLVTTDGGAQWRASEVPGASDLDFRDVEAWSEREAVLMSAGPGDKSRIYQTSDGGAHWTLLFTNPDAKGFFDSIAFWDRSHGILVGDAVDGHATIFTTADGGRKWTRQSTPDALPNEGSFAASGTCVIVRGKREAWFVTGGTGAGRVFQSVDGGKSWTAVKAPIRNDSAAAGIFSIAFAGGGRGMIVGGDYGKPAEGQQNVGVSSDNGAHWSQPSGSPSGFRSAVAWLAAMRAWVVTGTSGSDISRDDGASWKRFDDSGYNAMSFTRRGAGWAVGAKGRIARFDGSNSATGQ